MQDRNKTNIRVLPDHRLGALKRTHGVCKGIVDSNWWLDFRPWYEQWQVPSLRIHDTAHSVYDTVDLHHLFPDPARDPDDASNYQFDLTDDFLKEVIACGAEVYFRLGESIEHQPRMKWNRHDRWEPDQLARVCVNIMRHYNEGWANGFHHGIRYWEFWNEPDGPKNWTGSPEDFFRHYAPVARGLKNRDSSLKVGLAGFGASFTAPEAQTRTPWRDGLRRCVEEGVPIDFVSWHKYSDSWKGLEQHAHEVRAFMDSIGLKNAESHLGEWSYRPFRGRTSIFQAYKQKRFDLVDRFLEVQEGRMGAAFLFGMLCRFQEMPVEVTQYYAGDASRWGLFARSGTLNHRGAAFQTFAELVNTGDSWQRVGTDVAHDLLSVLAICSPDSKRLKIGIANMEESTLELVHRPVIECAFEIGKIW